MNEAFSKSKDGTWQIMVGLITLVVDFTSAVSPYGFRKYAACVRRLLFLF
jgi:hypothetical protein